MYKLELQGGGQIDMLKKGNKRNTERRRERERESE